MSALAEKQTAWRRGTFALYMTFTKLGEATADGYILGNVGVCRVPNVKYRAYQVIHIPTGFMLQNHLRTVDEAKACAEEYAPWLPTEGEYGKQAAPQMTKEGRKVCRSIRERWDEKEYQPKGWC